MKSKISLYTGLIIISILGYMIIFTGCVKLDDDEQDTYYMIEVDSISLADTITTADTLSISFYGTVGNNSCYSFSHFNPQLSQDVLNIEVWGKLSPGNNCATVMVYLEGKQLPIINFAEGTYFVKVKQPDGSSLNDTLTVLPAGYR